MTDRQHESDGDSRRSFMKKSTLAAGALAVGAGATGAGVSSVTAQEDEEGEVVVHAHDFIPGKTFDVVADLGSATEQELMEETYEDEFTDIQDWNAYIFHYDFEGPSGQTGILFTEDVRMSTGDQGTFDESASFRNAELNLVETDVTAEAADNGNDDDNDDADEEEEDEENDN